MIVGGDVYVADLNGEVRHRVLVVSNARFHDASRRAVVAPRVMADDDEVQPPWRVRVDDDVFAIDLVRSLPIDRLLERVDRAPAAVMIAVRRTLQHIT